MKVRLNDVADRITGNVDRFNTDLLYYLGGEHYESNQIAIYERGILKSENGAKLGFKFHFPFVAGDTIFMSRNPHLRKAGMVMYDGICSDTSYIIRTKNPDVLDPKYLPLVLQNDLFWDFFEANKSGSVNYLLNWKEMKDYEFDLPPIEEQRRVASIVWAAEDCRRKYLALKKATDSIMFATFVKMFGNLGADEKEWGLTSLGECCILNPKRPKGIPDELEVSFVPMPSVSEEGRIESSENKSYGEVKKGFTYFAENDVLFAKITPCMENGKGAVAKNLTNGIGAGSTEFHVLRPIEGKSNPYWLYAVTKFDCFRREARQMMTGTGGQLRVPISFLENYVLTLPPIELQNQFEKFVLQNNKSKNELENSIISTEKLIKSLIQNDIGRQEG